MHDCCCCTYLRSNCQQWVDKQWHIASTGIKAFVLTGYFFLHACIQLRASLACCFTSCCDGASGSALLPFAPPFFCMTDRVITMSAYKFYNAVGVLHTGPSVSVKPWGSIWQALRCTPCLKCQLISKLEPPTAVERMVHAAESVDTIMSQAVLIGAD